MTEFPCRNEHYNCQYLWVFILRQRSKRLLLLSQLSIVSSWLPNWRHHPINTTGICAPSLLFILLFSHGMQTFSILQKNKTKTPKKNYNHPMNVTEICAPSLLYITTVFSWHANFFHLAKKKCLPSSNECKLKFVRLRFIIFVVLIGY